LGHWSARCFTLKKTTFIWLLALLLTLGGCIGCSTNEHINYPQTNAELAKQGFAGVLQDTADFNALQGPPLAQKWAGVKSVKVVYDLDSKRMFFIGSNRFKYHHEFCSEILGYIGGLATFNLNNYTTNSLQSYVVADLNYFSQSGKYILQFTSSSKYDTEQIKTMFNACVANSYIKNLCLLVSTNHIEWLVSNGYLTLPTVTVSELYGNQKTQIIRTGVTYGYLQFTDSTTSLSSVKQPAIVVVHGTPLVLPWCEAVLSDEFQSPLSHIQVLCNNRKIPAAAELSIYTNEDWKSLDGKFVELVIDDNAIRISESSPEAAQAAGFQPKKPAAITNLKSNLNERQLLPASELKLTDHYTEAYGNKACGLGKLHDLVKRNPSLFKVPEGAFAIPFAYYNDHMYSSGAWALVEKIQQEQPTGKELKKRLKEVREAIKNTPLNAELVSAVNAEINKQTAWSPFRFRSSSNAEDGNSFNGAGLYDSESAEKGNAEKTAEKAILKVWASLWKEAPYVERSNFGLNQRTCMMGILVHRSFPQELINGVAITANLYRPGFPGYTISLQQGNTSVVQPPPGARAEQLVLMEDNDIRIVGEEISADFITLSNVSPNASLLSQAQRIQLYKALELVSEGMLNTRWSAYTTSWDLEWKFDADGGLYFKQIRPYRR
jgi:pyruvate,water dikinase